MKTQYYAIFETEKNIELHCDTDMDKVKNKNALSSKIAKKSDKAGSAVLGWFNEIETLSLSLSYVRVYID